MSVGQFEKDNKITKIGISGCLLTVTMISVVMVDDFQYSQKQQYYKKDNLNYYLNILH